MWTPTSKLSNGCAVDDLALYSGDFEFGTDAPTYIEVEFCAYPERVLQNVSSDMLLEEFISAVAVRVARDIMALLPVSKVLIHVEIDGKTVLSVNIARGELCLKNFRNNLAADIVQTFPHLVVRDLIIWLMSAGSLFNAHNLRFLH